MLHGILRMVIRSNSSLTSAAVVVTARAAHEYRFHFLAHTRILIHPATATAALPRNCEERDRR
jgi:hypothetical protein